MNDTKTSQTDPHATPDFSRLKQWLNAPVRQWQHLFGVVLVIACFGFAAGATSMSPSPNGGTPADPIVPADGTQNITGSLAVSSSVNSGNAVIGDVYTRDWLMYTATTTSVIKDNAGNAVATFYDDGTTGSMQLTGTKSRGTVTMNADNTTAATITVNSGAICVVASESSVAATPAFSVTTTTLTITNSATIGGKVMDYLCL